jgi:hypothetical protein
VAVGVDVIQIQHDNEETNTSLLISHVALGHQCVA